MDGWTERRTDRCLVGFGFIDLNKVSSLRRQLDGAVDDIRRLERRIDFAEHNLALRNVVLADVEEHARQQQFSTYDGTLLWKVTEVARRRNDVLS